MSLNDILPKFIKRIYAVSIIICPGSFVGLKLLNDKSFLPWLKQEQIPYFGYPLLIIFFASLLFGIKGLLDAFRQVNKIKNDVMEVLDKTKKDENI